MDPDIGLHTYIFNRIEEVRIDHDITYAIKLIRHIDELATNGNRTLLIESQRIRVQIILH